LKVDYGQGSLAGKTSADQDVSALATQQQKAKKLLLDKLGPMDGVTMTVYHVGDDFKTLTEINNPKEKGMFFAESCYVIWLKSS